MTNTPTFPSTHEAVESQLPAIHQLINLGFQYLPPAEVKRQRGGRLANCFLEDILAEQLRTLNQVETAGQTHPFTESAIQECVRKLKETQAGGLIADNEKAYHLLCLGRSVEQTHGGRKSSYTVRYIDWENPARNVFHVTSEFSVERSASNETRRPDIVCFVNGIPFAVIEAKGWDQKDGIEQAVSQNLRNQQSGEIPHFFRTQQLLLAVNGREGRYATVGTPTTHWLEWKEQSTDEEKLLASVNTPLSEEVEHELLAEPFKSEDCDAYRSKLAAGERLPTVQDRLIYSLLRPERLLELTYRYMVFDGGEKKVARYQQYFAVRDIVSRVQEFDEDGARKGGVVWHTQGSGKSLTMVMLAKALALCDEIPDPLVVLVTDRVDLDDQIEGTFKSCGLETQKAASGTKLVELLSQRRHSVITTVINKFKAACNKRGFRLDDPNIFVLVDEAHRTNYGDLHMNMRRVFTRACFIGFTGTPLMQRERSTRRKFGGIIGTPYTLKEAVEDGAVLSLRYEARRPEIDINREALDKQFKQQAEDLSVDEQTRLKKESASSKKIFEAEQVVRQIARDISKHYKENWKGTFAKGQIVTSGKHVAIMYKEALDEIGDVSSEVIISSPDDREGFVEVYGGNKAKVVQFWKKMMERYGNEKNYNRTLIRKFKKSNEPELLIVVNKLLTGFDAPRNTILYICSLLKNHTLLQAIARVNRPYTDPVTGEKKDHGYIIDYRGILEELSEALGQYNTHKIEGDDNSRGDVDEVLFDISQEIKRLSFVHSALWSVFKEVRNQKDREALEIHLEDEERRDSFYKAFNDYASVLASAKQSLTYYETVPEEKQRRYVEHLHFFAELRAGVRRRFSAEVDTRPYEQRIRKILDLNTVSSEVVRLTEMVNIFDREAFAREIERVATNKGRADVIISRTRKVISERWKEDPVFYRRFSNMIDKILEDYRMKRLNELDLLNEAHKIMDDVRDRTGDEVPASLKNRDVAKAYYGWTYEHLKICVPDTPDLQETSARLAIDIESRIDGLRVVNWRDNEDVKNAMSNAIEDAVLETGLQVPHGEMDKLIKDILDIAMKRLPNEAAS